MSKNNARSTAINHLRSVLGSNMTVVRLLKKCYCTDPTDRETPATKHLHEQRKVKYKQAREEYAEKEKRWLVPDR